MRGYDQQNSINRIAIGTLIVLIAIFCSLSLFGALGGVGVMVSSFLLGAFGYASYAYFIGSLLVGLAVIFKLRITLETKKMVGLILLLVIGIWALHVYTSSANVVGNDYGEYLNSCYKNQNTAGGGLFGLISYPFQKFFTNVGALIFVCVLFFVMIFFAVFPFIKGVKPLKGGYKNNKVAKGEKITAQKAPTLTVFNDSRPPSFIQLSQATDDNASNNETYNPIFPNKTAHLEDEIKINGRGAQFALGEEMNRNDKPHDISRGYYEPKETNGQLLKDLLFDKTLSEEKYREYLQNKQAKEEEFKDERATRIDDAYNNTRSKNQYGADDNQPSKIAEVLLSAERKRTEREENPFKATTNKNNNDSIIDFSRKAEYAKKSIPELKDPSEWDKPIQSEVIEFEQLKEQQRDLYRAKSKEKGIAPKYEKISKNNGPSIWDISANDNLNVKAGNIFGEAKQTWGNEGQKTSVNANGTHNIDSPLNQSSLYNQNGYNQNYPNGYAKNNQGQNAQQNSQQNQINPSNQNPVSNVFASQNFNLAQNQSAMQNNQANQGGANFGTMQSSMPNMQNSQGYGNIQNPNATNVGVNGYQNLYPQNPTYGVNPYTQQIPNSQNVPQQGISQQGMPQQGMPQQNVSQQGMPQGQMFVPFGGYVMPQDVLGQNQMPSQVISYVWTPNGYMPQNGAFVYSPNMVVQKNDAQAVPVKEESYKSDIAPLESENFKRDPQTGVYRSLMAREDENSKIFAPNLERGRQLNEDAERRRFSDIKKARLERMAELKQKQEERRLQKQKEEESKKLNLNEYNEAIIKGREAASQVEPNASKLYTQTEDNMAQKNQLPYGNEKFGDVQYGDVQAKSNVNSNAANEDVKTYEEAKPVVRSGFGTFFGKAGDLNIAQKPSEEETQNNYGTQQFENIEINDAQDDAMETDEEFSEFEKQRAKYLEKHNRKKKGINEPKVRTAQITIEESIEKTEPRLPYVAPPFDLLIPPDINMGPSEDLEEKKDALITTLAYFNVKAEVIEVVCGPAFSLFRLAINEMPRGKTITWLQTLENDLSMKMAEISVKILAPIPGENAVGVEVSNKKRRMVRISSLLKSKEFTNAKTPVSFALGEDLYGHNYVCDVKSLPHLLIAGQTGAGKSCCINTLIVSLLYHAGPDDLRFIMIDPKRMELSIYKGIPHLLLDDIIYDADKAIKALQWCIDEMQRRIDFFNKNGYRDIEEYNACKLEDDFVPMPRIVIVVDELAELMDRGSKTVENCIDRLARLARAVGIHLICATQRPSVDVISGTIKNNLPSRISFRVPTVNDSRTVLGVGGAENLLGDGDLLYMNPKLKNSVRVQGGFISGAEVKAVVEFLKSNNKCVYDPKIKDAIYKDEEKEIKEDTPKKSAISPKVLEAIKVGLEGSLVSISMLQRKLGVGYPRAGAIYDQLDKMGILGPPQKPTNGRPITMSQSEYEQLLLECEEED